MQTSESEIVLTGEEQELGFTVQTLTYPEARYEIPRLRGAAGGNRERCVALVLDDFNRLRRRRNGEAGYVHEAFDGQTWAAVAAFETLGDVAGSDAVRAYRRRRAAADDEPEAEAGGPDD